MDLVTTLRWAAERTPERVAVAGTGRRLTYREWDARTDLLAGALHRSGVLPGDRVVLLMHGGEQLASLHLALQKLGAVSVPLSTRFGVEELTYCLGDAAPRLVVADPAHSDRVVAAGGESLLRLVAEIDALAERSAEPAGPVAVDETATSVMLYTSGTTGKPKGVPRTHRAEHSAAVAHVMQTRQRQGVSALGVMPLFHTMGLRTLLASIIVGGTWVGQPAFDAEESMQLILDERIGSLYLVPTIYWALLRTGRLAEARTLDNLAYAGAAMTPSLAEKLVDEVGPASFVNHFGSTEIYTFTIGPDVAAKPGCAGRAGLFSRVRLIAPDAGAPVDELVKPGEQGQVIVSMDSMEAFGGYWQRPDANAKSIREGWYHTGDLAVADDDGDLWVSGRTDDMINSGGENVYPDEIESVLARCPEIDDVCVVGLPDERWGHAVSAFVVPVPGADPMATAERAMAFARENLPSLKRPKRVIAVDSVPRSGVGKTLRRTLVAGEYESRGELRA
ncbi:MULTISPECIES: class I adenylate-forming enzyme family protein [Pseudonocardia]|uniref:Long-chain-fatty-acid--CoA ligase FadD13 n=2 Tax=Pseudonocardia TaxID=1847 RepID=A0A1Y2MR28_PSEAH|nr:MULTISPECIES: AMP-binding protein [Pseudonocardia]OSY37167.1 Long-chain-fatty-acid--CoA ligase FadD13 [Pseudonocardia autotrophica]TDN74788.1 2-furoate---CoA ligase [Pseudonocardia autotrophica]BBG05563.1 4-chlorobenzoate--CoA ligase [Pseudonocardia autotrophica]GEC25814.1 4-chlorobenzoate--CoA ligase [Pseudonocardia saturnea]